MFGLFKTKHKMHLLQISLEVLAIQQTVRVQMQTAQAVKDYLNQKILSL